MCPSFRLLGGLGLRASELNNLFEHGSFRWSYGGILNWSPLLIPVYGNLAWTEDADFQVLLLQCREAVYRAAQVAENAAVGFSSSQAGERPEVELRTWIRGRLLFEGVSERQIPRETRMRSKALEKTLGHREPGTYRRRAFTPRPKTGTGLAPTARLVLLLMSPGRWVLPE